MSSRSEYTDTEASYDNDGFERDDDDVNRSAASSVRPDRAQARDDGDTGGDDVETSVRAEGDTGEDGDDDDGEVSEELDGSEESFDGTPR
jgi:hypothetical protein